MLIILAPITICLGFGCLLYCIKPSKGSIYDKIRSKILTEIPDIILTAISNITGVNVKKKFREFIHYLINTNNPLTQIFYILLFPGCYTLFVFYLMIPNHGLYSIYDHLFGHPIVMFAFWSYYKTCVVNPGILTKSNFKYYKEKYKKYAEGSLFRNEVCSTCNIPKPARSKHCKICDVCVSRLDHHCIWIRGCVGEHNYKYFLMFIFSHALMCFVGFVLSLKYLDHICIKYDLWNQIFTTKSGEQFEASWYIVFRYLFNEYEIVMFLFILCLILCITLFCFLAYHMSMIAKGSTMSESGKISDFLHKVENTNIRFDLKVKKYIQDFPGEENDPKRKERLRKALKAKFDEEYQEIKKEITIVHQNYRDTKFWNNLKIIFWS